MIAEEDDQTTLVSLDDDSTLPARAFAGDSGLPDKLRLQVGELASKSPLERSLAQLFELAISPLPERRLRVLTTFISHASPSKHDIGAVSTVVAEIIPLLLSHELDPLARQFVLEIVLCQLVRFIHRFTALEADDGMVEALSTLCRKLCKKSSKAALFQDLLEAAPHKLLKRALKHGDKYLGIGLVCSQPLTADRYAALMLQTQAATTRRKAWAKELRRLFHADTASFVKVASVLVIDPHSLSECALMLAAIRDPDDRDLFVSAMGEALQGAPTGFSADDLLFSLGTVAFLHRALDAISRDDPVTLSACFTGHWILKKGRMTHPKLLLDLSKQLGHGIRHASEELRSFWPTVRDWLHALEPAPGLTSSSGTESSTLLPPCVFADFELPAQLSQKVLDLSKPGQTDGTDKELAKLTLASSDLAERLELLAAFVCHADAGNLDLKSVVVAMTKITPLFESDQIKGWFKQDVLQKLLCALIRHMRHFAAMHADSPYLEMLHKAFRRLRKCSPKSKLFKLLATVAAQEVMEHALKHEELSIGLACGDPLSPARYGTLMVQTGATSKRNREWTRELRRLHCAHEASFLAIASLLVLDRKTLPECGLMLACVPPGNGKQQFEASLMSSLKTAQIPLPHDDLVFSVKILAMLYAARDAANRRDWAQVMTCLGDYWNLTAQGFTHRKQAEKLIAQLDDRLIEALPATSKFWAIVKAWLLKLEPPTEPNQ